MNSFVKTVPNSLILLLMPLKRQMTVTRTLIKRLLKQAVETKALMLMNKLRPKVKMKLNRLRSKRSSKRSLKRSPKRRFVVHLEVAPYVLVNNLLRVLK